MMKPETAMTSRIQAAAALVTVPWNAFVAAFMYYTLLTALVLGGISPSLAVVGTAYLAPIVAYFVTIAARLIGHATHRMGAAPVVGQA
jgi:hypothetical protein